MPDNDLLVDFENYLNGKLATEMLALNFSTDKGKLKDPKGHPKLIRMIVLANLINAGGENTLEQEITPERHLQITIRSDSYPIGRQMGKYVYNAMKNLYGGFTTPTARYHSVSSQGNFAHITDDANNRFIWAANWKIIEADCLL